MTNRVFSEISADSKINLILGQTPPPHKRRKLDSVSCIASRLNNQPMTGQQTDYMAVPMQYFKVKCVSYIHPQIYNQSELKFTIQSGQKTGKSHGNVSPVIPINIICDISHRTRCIPIGVIPMYGNWKCASNIILRIKINGDYSRSDLMTKLDSIATRNMCRWWRLH